MLQAKVRRSHIKSRGTFDTLSCSIGISCSTWFRALKRGELANKVRRFHPYLTIKNRSDRVKCRETNISPARGWKSTPDVIVAKKSANIVVDDPTLVTRRSFDDWSFQALAGSGPSGLEGRVTLLPTSVRFDERPNGRSDLREWTRCWCW